MVTLLTMFNPTPGKEVRASKQDGDTKEVIDDDGGARSPRSSFEADEIVDTSAKESDFNNHFLRELKKEKKNCERKPKPLKKEKPKDENIETVVELFKEFEEHQQQSATIFKGYYRNSTKNWC